MSEVHESAILPAAAETADRWSDHHPLERTVLTGGLLLVVLLTMSPAIALMVLLVTSLMAVARAGVPLGRWSRSLLVPLGFLLPTTLVLALRLADPAEGSAWSLSVDAAALRLGGVVAVRALACVSCTLLLVHTTPIHVLALALRRAGMPVDAVDTVLLTARLIQLLATRVAALARAVRMRHGLLSWRARVRSVSLLAATVLVDALERSRRLEAGLGGRGGLGHDVIARPTWQAVDRGRLLVAALLPLSVLLLSRAVDPLSWW